MKALVHLAQKVGPSNVPVLIAGETGAGKEVIAELIHNSSERKDKPMVCINCAGLPTELIESELFGSSKGSFTGSNMDRIGLFKSADRGTAFLDELSEMPLELQSKLLRFLQDKRIRRVGAIASEPVDVRVIAAVNRDPKACVDDKRLREDLYYRLNTVTIWVPPLRERIKDILPLASAYLTYYAGVFNRPVPELTEAAKNWLLAYMWPGNVRQLQNEINRCVLLSNNGHIDADILAEQPMSKPMNGDVNSDGSVAEAEINAILKALDTCDGNKLLAAKKLGLGRQTLYNKLRYYGITTTANVVRPAKPTRPRSAPAASKAVDAPAPSPALPSPRASAPSAESPAEPSAEPLGGGLLD
jgi:transcriptional regulator with PAS, ATPase and Fis domain